MICAAHRLLTLAGLLSVLFLPSAAEGQEVFGGVYEHDVGWSGGGHIENRVRTSAWIPFRTHPPRPWRPQAARHGPRQHQWRR